MRIWVLTGLALAMSAGAQWWTSLDGSGEVLSRPGSDSWLDGTFLLGRKDPSWGVHGGWRETRRYGLRDAEALMGVSLRNAGRLWSVEGTHGIETHYLATNSVKLGVVQPLGAGWLVSLDGKVADYSSIQVVSPTLLLERYHGAWHGGLGLSGFFAPSDQKDWGWRALLDRSWSDRSAAGVQVGQSTDHERVGALIVATQVTSVTGMLRQELTAGLLVRGNLGWTRQGDAYQRWGGGLGLELSFGQ